MEMLMNDFGTIEFKFNGKVVELNYLVFMEKFYAMVKKESELIKYFTESKDALAEVKVLKANNKNILNKESKVKIEIMDQESRIAHVYDHLDMVENNYFEKYDTTLTAIKCSLVK